MRFPVAAVVFFGLAAAAAAEGAPAIRSAAGSCAKLVVAGQDATASCAGKISSTALPDGTVFFIFKAGETMVGFSGRKAELVPGAPWPVRFVNIGAPGREPNAIPATGSCRIADPDRVSGPTVCSAKTEQGRFEAEFVGPPGAAKGR